MSLPRIPIDRDSQVPVYRQIADGIRAALQSKTLPSGRRLPPTRDLARELGVNRNTVVAAYEALAAEGLTTSRTGKGTFLVSPDTPEAVTIPEEGRWHTAFSRAVEGPGVGNLLSVYRVATSADGISFAGSYPAPDLMPVSAFAASIRDVMTRRATEALSYGPTAGLASLRSAIAADMRRKGSRVTPEEILITNGSQQAIEITLRALVDRGDPVVVEEPTYTGALSVLGALGARLVGVPMDERGIRPELLALALERHRPRVIYLQPTFQNPTACVMDEARRREVLSLAARHRCAVVEDDWAGDLRLEGAEVPTLHALDGGRHVVYVSTFSKKFLPGLRIGWVAAPAVVLSRLEALKQIEDFGTSPLLQAALVAFLEEGGLEEHLKRVRVEYRSRRDRMLTALARHFPPGVRWTRPEGGLFVWVTLPEAIEASELFHAARDRGVLFSRGELFHAGGGGKNALRLTYGSVAPDQIDAGIEILGDLIRERWPEGSKEREGRVEEAVPIL